MTNNLMDHGCQKLVWDRMEGIPYPGEHSNLFGHDGALAIFSRAFQSGRVHHAWLVTGVRGVGKASLAFVLAGHILRNPDTMHMPLKGVRPPNDDDPVFSRIAKGAHPNVLHLSHPWDEKKKSFSSHLTVNEVRRAVSFFEASAGEDNWRICIVDTADDMNTHAANALLKTLEEPPARTIFFVLGNSPGQLLATLRSRCHQLSLKPLDNKDLWLALNSLGVASSLDETDRKTLARLCGGSVRRALTLLQQDGLQLYQRFHDILDANNSPFPDWAQAHGLADELSVKNRQDQYRLLIDIAQDYIDRILHLNAARASVAIQKPPSEIYAAKTMLSNLAQMCEAWQKTVEGYHIAESYNLDKKQVILDLFGSLAKSRQLNAN